MRGAHGFPGGPARPPYGEPVRPDVPSRGDALGLPARPPTGEATVPDPATAVPEVDDDPPGPTEPPVAAPAPPPPPPPDEPARSTPADPAVADPGAVAAASHDRAADRDRDAGPSFAEVVAGPHPLRGAPRWQRARRPARREGGVATGGVRRPLGRRLARGTAIAVGSLIAFFVVVGIVDDLLGNRVADLGGGEGTFLAVDLEHCETVSATDPDEREEFGAGAVLAGPDGVRLGASAGLGDPVWTAPAGAEPRGELLVVPSTDDAVFQVVHDDGGSVRFGRYVAATGELVAEGHLRGVVLGQAADVLWFGAYDRGNTLLWSLDLTTARLESCFAAVAADDEELPPLAIGPDDPRITRYSAAHTAADPDALYLAVERTGGVSDWSVERLGRDGTVRSDVFPDRPQVVGVGDGDVHLLVRREGRAELVGVDTAGLAETWRVVLLVPGYDRLRTVTVGDELVAVELGHQLTSVMTIEPDGAGAGQPVQVPRRFEAATVAGDELWLSERTYDAPPVFQRRVDGEVLEVETPDVPDDASIVDADAGGVVVGGVWFDGRTRWSGVQLVDGEVALATEDTLVRVGPDLALLWVRESFGRSTLVAVELASDEQAAGGGGGGGDGRDDDEQESAGGGGGDDDGDDELGGSGGGGGDEGDDEVPGDGGWLP